MARRRPLSAEILKLALREAVLNQAYSFNYADRICYIVGKKNLRTKQQVEEDQTKKTADSSKRSRTVSSTRRIAESLTEKLVGGVAEYVKQTKTMEALENDVWNVSRSTWRTQAQ